MSLEARFGDVLNSGNADSDPLYLVASYLDRSVVSLLTSEDCEKAKRALLHLVIYYSFLGGNSMESLVFRRRSERSSW